VSGKRDLVVGLVVIRRLEPPGLLQYAACTGMGILDVWAALPLEVKRLLPVKDRALLGRYLKMS